LSRVMDFVGYDADLTEFVCGVIGARGATRRSAA
jgi:hypothetical protein